MFAFTLSTALGCGDDEELDVEDSGVGSLGGGGSGGNGGTSGGTGGSGGTADSATGATGGTVGGGGAGGSAGSAGSAGSGGSAGDDAGDECEPSGTSYQFNWCPALISPNQAPATSTQIVPFYFGQIHADCRISAFVDTHPELAQFANELTAFTLQLWGCQGSGVTTFGLAQTGYPDASFTTFTAADAELLIEIYVTRTKEVLSLGPTNQKLLEDTLHCLAKDMITDPSTTEYSMSVCAPDAGTEDASLDGGTD